MTGKKNTNLKGTMQRYLKGQILSLGTLIVGNLSCVSTFHLFLSECWFFYTKVCRNVSVLLCSSKSCSFAHQGFLCVCGGRDHPRQKKILFTPTWSLSSEHRQISVLGCKGGNRQLFIVPTVKCLWLFFFFLFLHYQGSWILFYFGDSLFSFCIVYHLLARVEVICFTFVLPSLFSCTWPKYFPTFGTKSALFSYSLQKVHSLCDCKYHFALQP